MAQSALPKLVEALPKIAMNVYRLFLFRQKLLRLFEHDFLILKEDLQFFGKNTTQIDALNKFQYNRKVQFRR